MNPNGPVDVCLYPRVTCDDICCPTNYICSASSVCVKKPPPPPPGSVSITWFTDRVGTPNVIAVHGSGFAAGAAVSIIESWVTYTDHGTPEYHEFHVWSRNFSNVASFDYATGMQDCSRFGSPGGGNYGEPAVVQVMDWALLEITQRIPVRTQWGGLCTANQA